MDDFDEFGNFIGQEYSSSSSEEASDVEYLDQQMPTQSINEPLVKRRDQNRLNENAPENWEFHKGLMSNLALVRNIAFIGHMGHGKTTWYDILTNEESKSIRGQATHQSSFCSILGQISNEKSYVFNICDTPGNKDFEYEVESSLKLCDGAVLFVDVCEGMLTKEYPVSPQVVVLNKIDRLILDLRLPPPRAYDRLKVVMDEVSHLYPNASIVFGSGKFEFSFTLDSIEKLYEVYKGEIIKITPETFSSLVLEPIYKLFVCALTKNVAVLESLGIKLTNKEWNYHDDERIRIVMEQYLEGGEILDRIVDGVPPPSLKSEKRTKNVLINKNEFTISTFVDGYVPLSGNTVCYAEGAPWALTPGFTSTDMNIYAPYTVGIEPVKDIDLTQFLKRLNQLYGLKFLQNATGEYTLYGTGELYLDFVIRQLRNMVECDLRVSQPLPIFRETVSEESSMGVPTKSGSNLVVVIASPESEANVLHKHQSCVLHSDLEIEDEVLQDLISGFVWCVEQGPLLDSPIQDVHFTLTELECVSTRQIAALMQRACCSAFLLASPRILEPQLTVTVVGRVPAGKALYSELDKRGALVTHDTPIYGTNLYLTEGEIPIMDSFGLQIDILCQLESRDYGYVFYTPNGWKQVCGDPLIEEKALRLEAADNNLKARDYMIKIRRRKGLIEVPQLERYLDEDVKLLLM